MTHTAPGPTAHRRPLTNRPRRKREIVGPYSRLIDRGALGAINGSSREGRYLRDYEKRLLAHVGGTPSVTQRALITRASRLALHLELLDQRALVEGRGRRPFLRQLVKLAVAIPR